MDEQVLAIFAANWERIGRANLGEPARERARVPGQLNGAAVGEVASRPPEKGEGWPEEEHRPETDYQLEEHVDQDERDEGKQQNGSQCREASAGHEPVDRIE